MSDEVGQLVTIVLNGRRPAIDGVVRVVHDDGLTLWTDRSSVPVFVRWDQMAETIWGDEECEAWRQMIAGLRETITWKRSTPILTAA